MCKKLLVLTSLILFLGSVSVAEDIQWTGGGRNKFWSTAANWDLSRPPTLDDDVRIDVPAAAAPNGPIIQEGVDAKAKGIFTEAAGEPTLTMTGGTLEVSDYIWWGDGMDSYAVWTMSGGNVTVANELELGWGGGAGTLTMTGGMINAGELIIPTGSGAFGEMFLHGGTVNVTQPGGLEVNANGLLDITDGTLVLEGDDTAKVNDLAAAGLITALGGEGILDVEYDVRNPGKTTVTAAAMAPGLVAYYAMENDANDSSGNGNHGTIMGDPEFVEGISGMAMAFDGDGDIVDCGNDRTLALSGAVTLAAWINVNVQGLDHKVGGNQDGANGGYKMSVYNDKIEFEIRTAANSAVLNRSVAGGTFLEAGVWYHVVGVYSLEDGYIRTYVDGALDRELIMTDELGVSPGNFIIGAEPFNTGSYNFNGVMDEIRLYNFALNEHEVMGLAGQPVAPGADGLVAHYALENDANDSSVNALHGTIVGDPAFVEGPVGMALDFDGDGDYVDCGNDPAFSVSEAITVSLWVNIRAIAGDWRAIIAKGDSAWRISSNASTTGMHFGFTGSDRDYQRVDSVTELPFDEWDHVCATYDMTDGGHIYINGIVDGANPDVLGISTNDQNVFIGNNSENPDRFWDGLIDEVIIYNRKLSTGEAKYLAGHRAAPVNPGSEGLLARWTCDEGAGAVVADVSGNGRDGTFVNGDPAWVEGVSGSAVELIGPTLVETPPLDLELTQATMAGWIKPYGPQPEWSSVIMQRDPGLATGFNILGYQLAYHWNDTSDSWGHRGGDMIAEDDWTFAAVTIKPDKASFYVNGETGSVNEVSHGPCLWNSNVYLGGDGTAGFVGRRMIGALDDVLIYDRALSDGEIRYLAGFRENLLQNPSFEEDEAILDDPDWVQWCTWNPAEGAGSNATIVDTESADGAKSLRIEPKGAANWHFIVLYLPIMVDMDKNYDISFWAKAEAPRPLTMALKAEDNSIAAWGATDFELTTEWAEYSYTSEVLIDVVKLEIWCSGTEDPFWLDLVSMSEGN